MNAVDAVRAGSRAALDEVFRTGGSLNAQDKFGQTALMVAAGANPNLIAKNGLTALRCTVDAGAREAARLIKQAGAR